MKWRQSTNKAKIYYVEAVFRAIIIFIWLRLILGMFPVCIRYGAASETALLQLKFKGQAGLGGVRER